MSTSLYDYSDKSVRHAAYAAIVYGALSVVSVVLAWLRVELDQARAPRTAWFVYAIIVAIASGILAVGIFRRSRLAIVFMLLVVIIPQLLVWFVTHSFSGTIVSVIVTGFLLRGAARIFERSEDEVSTSKA